MGKKSFLGRNHRFPREKPSVSPWETYSYIYGVNALGFGGTIADNHKNNNPALYENNPAPHGRNPALYENNPAPHTVKQAVLLFAEPGYGFLPRFNEHNFLFHRNESNKWKYLRYAGEDDEL